LPGARFRGVCPGSAIEPDERTIARGSALRPGGRRLLAALRLSRDHSVRFADGAGFVACIFQALVRDLRPQLL
jgi:hypothetical protein